MPSRILRDGILTSRRVNRLSERAELFYYHLLSVADDYGRYHAQIPILRANCYPMRLGTVSEGDVAGFLQECVREGLVQLYEDGTFLQIWNYRQQVRSRSKFPDPPVQQMLSNCTSQAEAEAKAGADSKAESYAKTKPGGKRSGNSPPTAFSSSAIPSLEEVVEHGQRIGCTESACRKFFRHFEGKANGWKAINWRKRLAGWLEEDQERTQKKPKRREGGVRVEDYL
jgi:hypothetical protein